MKVFQELNQARQFSNLINIQTTLLHIAPQPTLIIAVIRCLVLLPSRRPYHLVYFHESNKMWGFSIVRITVDEASYYHIFNLLRRSFRGEVSVWTLKFVCCSEYPNVTISMADNILTPYGGIT